MKKNKKFLSILAALAISFSTLILPFSNAYADLDGQGETRAKNFIYAYAITECLKTYLSISIADSVTIGTDVATALAPTAGASVKVGPWLGGATGTITCQDAFKGLFGSEKVTQEMLETGGLLSGVYAAQAGAELTLECWYGIRNAENNGFMSSTGGSIRYFQYPQGYSQNGTYELSDHRSIAGMSFHFDSTGYLSNYGADISGINPNIHESIKGQWANRDFTSADDDALDALCSQIVRNVNVYSEDGTYVPVFHNDEAYGAQTGYVAGGHWTHDVDTVTSGNTYARQSGAIDALKTNFKNIYFTESFYCMCTNIISRKRNN